MHATACSRESAGPNSAGPFYEGMGVLTGTALPANAYGHGPNGNWSSPGFYHVTPSVSRLH